MSHHFVGVSPKYQGRYQRHPETIFINSEPIGKHISKVFDLVSHEASLRCLWRCEDSTWHGRFFLYSRNLVGARFLFQGGRGRNMLITTQHVRIVLWQWWDPQESCSSISPKRDWLLIRLRTFGSNLKVLWWCLYYIYTSVHLYITKLSINIYRWIDRSIER